QGQRRVRRLAGRGEVLLSRLLARWALDRAPPPQRALRAGGARGVSVGGARRGRGGNDLLSGGRGRDPGPGRRRWPVRVRGQDLDLASGERCRRARFVRGVVLAGVGALLPATRAPRRTSCQRG